MFEKSFLYHKAMGKKVTLRFEPMENFNPGDASGLVNGIEASNRYNDGQWFGFSGVNLEAVIDLGSVQTIQEIGTNVLKYHWQKMWEPIQLSFAVSSDNLTYQTIYVQTDFPVNGINKIRAKFPAMHARYIQIIATNRGLIPPGEYIAGAKAMLLCDEIWVY